MLAQFLSFLYFHVEVVQPCLENKNDSGLGVDEWLYLD